MTTATSLRTDRRHAGARHWMRLAAAALVVAGGVGGMAGMAAGATSAADPTPVPKDEPGVTTCNALAARFGIDGPVHEIRFSNLPAVGASKTGSTNGVTVTVTRLTPQTMAWKSTAGIDLVWVNAGRFPNESNQAYRYDPPSTGASGLRGTVPSNIIDHVLVCFGGRPAPTTAAPPPTADTIPPPTIPQAPPPTFRNCAPCATQPPASVPRLNVIPPSAAPPAATERSATTVVPFRLPETGTHTSAVVFIGVVLLLAGLLIWVAGHVLGSDVE